MTFERNVFVNCPFDDKFRPLLRPLLFTIYYLGFTPRIALERLNSAEVRIEKIIGLIEESKYSIHDLSRLKAETAGEFYRLNMPFELGIDFGCRRFKGGESSEKKCLILEAERHRYQAALSDVSGSDIEVHENEPEEIVAVVRNWLNHEANLAADGPAAIWGAFTDFMADNYDELTARGFSPRNIERLSIAELMRFMEQWVEARA
ncbi:hypothetical protein [Synechococcus sp. PCC 7336]|uniref:hypothetical protein n=1 Tax=Synechococcus sp. PCC 7336 TaxID=195250 RepID=UPI0003724AAB|nr:hypothetical protein [Synechococcus sp. PCC 7336]